MHVYRPVLRHRQNIVRQDAPVGHDDENIRLQRLYHLKRRPVAHLDRLVDRYSVFERQHLYRRSRKLHPAPLGLIGLGENADDVALFIYKLFQRGRREVRRPHKNYPHFNILRSEAPLR